MSDARIAGKQLRSFLQRVSRISKITSKKLMSLRPLAARPHFLHTP